MSIVQLRVLTERGEGNKEERRGERGNDGAEESPGGDTGGTEGEEQVTQGHLQVSPQEVILGRLLAVVTVVFIFFCCCSPLTSPRSL